MKTYIFLIVITLLFVNQKWDYISSFLPLHPDYALAHDVDVVMYGTSWCGYCAKTRKLLREHDVSYFEYDIEKSREGYEQYSSLGGRGVPVLLIDGRVVKGYNPSRIRQLIDDI